MVVGVVVWKGVRRGVKVNRVGISWKVRIKCSSRKERNASLCKVRMFAGVGGELV